MSPTIDVPTLYYSAYFLPSSRNVGEIVLTVIIVCLGTIAFLMENRNIKIGVSIVAALSIVGLVFVYKKYPEGISTIKATNTNETFAHFGLSSSDSKTFYLSPDVATQASTHSHGKKAATFEKVSLKAALTTQNSEFNGYSVCVSNDYPCFDKESLASYQHSFLNKFNEALQKSYGLTSMSQSVAFVPADTSNLLSYLDSHGVTYKQKNGELTNCALAITDITKNGVVTQERINKVYCSMNNQAKEISPSSTQS